MDKVRFQINKKQLLTILALLLLHAFIVKTPLISAVVGLIEFAICLISLLNNNLKQLFLLLALFISTSFDISSFVNEGFNSNLYSILNLPLVNGYHFYFLTLLIGLVLINKIRNQPKSLLIPFKKMVFFTKYLIYFLISASFFGVFTIFINDNEILQLNTFVYFLSDFLWYLVITTYFFGFCYLLIFENNFHKQIRDFLSNYLIGIVIYGFISILIGMHGYYGSEKILLSPLPFFFAASIIYFSIFYKSQKLLLIAVSALFLYVNITLPNALSGKLLLFILIAFLSILYFLFRTNKKNFILSIVLISLSLSSVFLSFDKLRNETSFISGKFVQAYLLLSVSQNDWFENLPSSPKVRVEEFISIAQEYTEKPGLALFGKGFSGSTRNHLNSKDWRSIYSFTQDQTNNNTYILMHESLNTIFLKNGLVGLAFFLLMISVCFYNIHRSPWLLIGGIWFSFFFGYSITLLFIGIPALTIGLYEIDLLKWKKLK